MIPRRSIALIAVLAVLALGIAAVESRRVAAQSPGAQTVQPGTAAIWTDKQQYNIGEPIQVCYRIPFQGNITITDLPSSGQTQVFYQGPSSGTSGCLPGTVTPPAGQECLRLAYPLAGGTGQTQACFLVVGPQPPPPPSGLAIYTDRASYNIGDAIQICYRVPSPGPFTIIDILANGTQQTLSSGYDDGTGGCIPGTVTPPAGTECLRINFGNLTSQTCFRVNGPLPPPPSGWTAIGSAQVDGNGNWHFGSQVQVDTALTYMRVTSGNCDSNPATVLVWEGNLVRDNASRIGVDVYDGDLNANGLAVSSGGGGHARLTRPVTLNPPTQVDATLWSVGAVYNSTNLTVCMRTP